MLLPYRCKNPPETFPLATYLLIAINIAVYAVTSDGFVQVKESVVDTYGLSYQHMSARNWAASLFLHGDPMHLLGNCWFLHIFGASVEGRLKTPKFLVLYFFAGLTGDFLHMAIFGPSFPDIPTIGASGAIMGVMGAAIYMFPHAEVLVFYGYGFYWGTTSWALLWVGIMYVAFDVVGVICCGPYSGVANLAHLGGVGGGLLFALIARVKRDTETQSQARSVLADSHDLGILNKYELRPLADTAPDDPLVALHWFRAEERAGFGFSAQCLDGFRRNLRKMIETLPVESVGQALVSYEAAGYQVPIRDGLQIALKLEGSAAPNLAATLYDLLLKRQDLDKESAATALLRRGIVSETKLGLYEIAVAHYEQVVRVDSMSPLAEQARHRIASLKRIGRA